MPAAVYPLPPPAAPRRRGGWAGRLALVLLAPVVWVLLLEVNTEQFGPGLDPSYVAVMTHCLAEHVRFGAEVIFTYGPLSPLVVNFFDARTFGLVFAGQLFIQGAVVFLVVRLAWDARGWRRWPLPLALLAVPTAWQTQLFFAAAGAGFVVAGRARVDRWLTLPALFLLAVLALVKGTLLVLAGLAVALGALACGLRWGWRPALARVVGFAAVLGALWVGLGQRAGDLPAFIVWTLDIAGGYSRGLSLPPEIPGILPLGLIALTLVAGQTAVLAWAAGRRDRAAWPLALLLGGTLFLAWKQGFTRADAHVAAFFDYVLVGAAAGPLFLASATPVGRVGAWAHGLVLAAAAGLFVAGDVQAGLRPGNVGNILRYRWERNLAMLADPRAYAQRLKGDVRISREANERPRIRAAVGRETVDVFGTEQGMALANRLRYTAPPVFQGYQANTPLTQTLNRDFYRGPRAPEFVMFKLQPIDEHPPAAENAGVLATVLADYAPVLVEGGFLLLRRAVPRDPGPGPHPLPFVRTLAEGELALDEPLPVPAPGPGEMVWCELDLRESLAGKLLATAYHQIGVQLEVSFTDGRAPRRFRLAPPMVRTGFLLSPFLESERGLVALQAGRAETTLPTVRAVRLVHENPALAQQFQPRWGYRLRSLPAPGAAVREAAAAFLDRGGFEDNGGVLVQYSDVAKPPPARVHSEAAATERFQLEGTTFVLVHARGEMEWELPPGRTRVRGRFAMRPDAWSPGQTDGAEFRVEFQPRDGTPPPTVLLDRLLRPNNDPADRSVQDFDLVLPPEAGAAGGRLTLRTLPGPSGATNFDFTAWGGVRIE